MKENKKSETSYSGFVILRLSSGYPVSDTDDLREFAMKNQFSNLVKILEKYNIVKTRRLIHSLTQSKILELENIKNLNDKSKAPIHSLTAYWRLDCRNVSDMNGLLKILRALQEVDTAYRELKVTDPAVNPGDDTYNTTQNYLDAASTGINARWAWNQTNGIGAGIAFIDLEQGWFPNHEDLPGPTILHGDNKDGVGGYKGDHGTAVLGEVVGVDNTVGIVGIAPGITSTNMVSHYDATSNTNGHVADAIVAAITNLNVGDVLLLEVQRSLLPTEIDDADFDAIRLAVAHGIIVIEAAGNGNEDLDTWQNSNNQQILNPASPQFRDSGAIIVGASESAFPHDRWASSNFGLRIDCFGWGENIVTAGYGDLDAGTGDDSTYTDSFGGTSGASPMIAGAALIVQGMYEANTNTRLSPGQMRTLLSTLGTSQGPNTAGNIGIMPDLQQILQNVLGVTPDIYLRDYVGDTGEVPSTGAISSSPDVIIVPNPVIDPTASFGEGSGTENSNILGYQVEAGQDNYIYVRMRNRGGASTNAQATVYWSEVSTLVTPDMWNLIGSSSWTNVPVGDTLVVTGPIVWGTAMIPATGHYCFVALLDSLMDSAPPIPPATDWDGFIAFIRNHNNVTWRNINVVDVEPDPAGDPAILSFLIAGALDRTRIFDIEIHQRLPEDAQLWLELPLALLENFKNWRLKKVEIDKKKDTAKILLPRLRSINLKDVKLNKSSRYRCQFNLKASKSQGRGEHLISVRQLFKGEEVGRVTWTLRPRKWRNRISRIFDQREK
jgi:hypothetical protein